MIDVDGNRFPDCHAETAVVAAGRSHPKVVRIQEQAAKLIPMSGTNFYSENMALLAE